MYITRMTLIDNGFQEWKSSQIEDFNFVNLFTGRKGVGKTS
jgi:recombinational DNA repair ATPase RecF